MYKCLECGSSNIKTERSPKGKIECGDCGFILRERGSDSKMINVNEEILNNYNSEVLCHKIKISGTCRYTEWLDSNGGLADKPCRKCPLAEK